MSALAFLKIPWGSTPPDPLVPHALRLVFTSDGVGVGVVVGVIRELMT